MLAAPDRRWERLIRQKRSSLGSTTLDGSFRTKNYEGFQAYFSSVVVNQEPKNGTDVVQRFIISLDSLRLFSTAVTTASRDDEGLQIIWASLHALIESASRSPQMLETVLRQITDLNQALSPLEPSINLCSDQPQLHWFLQNLFDDYLSFCTRCLYHLRAQPQCKDFAVAFAIAVAAALVFAALIQTRQFEVWSYLLILITLSLCCLILGGLYLCFVLNWARDYEKSSVANDLLYTRATIKGHHRTLEEQISRLERDVGSYDHSTVTSVLSTPSTHSSKVDSILDVSAGRSSLPIRGRPVQNFSFLGRESQLASIHDTLQFHLKPSKRGPACCIIHGIGGIGKTQTALQYTYAYEHHYEAIFWLKAQTNMELAKSYAAIADEVGTPEITQGLRQDEDLGKGIDIARRWLQMTSLRWLLVFDNVDDLKYLAEYIPSNPTGKGGIIVTTQLQYFKRFTDVFLDLPLESLDTAAGFELLFETLGKERWAQDDQEEDAVYEILDIVGGLPLAITTIGGHVKQSGSTLSEFLGHLKQSNSIWAISGKSFVEHYEKTLGTVFDIALRELPSDRARSFLHILAFLNPDCIPEEMFLSYRGNDLSLRALSDRNTLTIMTRDLTLRQLIKREGSSDGHFLSIHRSLQLCILDGLSSLEATRKTAFRQAFALIYPQLPLPSKVEVSEPKVFDRYAKYVPQVISLRTHSLWPQPPLKLSLDFAQVMANIGIFMWNVGLLKDGMAALETAEDVLQDLNHDKDDPLMSDIDLPLGIIYDFVGVSRRKEALFRRKRALDIRSRAYDAIPRNDRTITDKIRLFNAEADLGCALLQQERFSEAMKKFEHCLVQYKSWESVEEKLPFEYSKYYNHSAFGQASQGRYLEAIALSRRACHLLQLHSGPKSPLVLLYRFVLGNHLYHAADLTGSLRLNEEVLQARRDICGEANPYTQESYSFTGMLLSLCNRHEEARSYLETSLETNRRIHWSEEGVAYAHFRLAKILRKIGEHDEAAIHKSQAAAIRDKFLKAHLEYLEECPHNEVAIYDQMISIWSGRCTYRLKDQMATTTGEFEHEMIDLVEDLNHAIEEI